ncbi:MAG: hypothetical protein ACTTH5_06845 [Wolinella sp.]
MIEMMDYVDSRFSLDLMLVKTWGQDSYYEKLENMAKRRKNVKIIPPVPFEEIIPFSRQYDIGLYILKPSGFNTLHALPNKFFEYIHAHLAIAVSPSPEMAEIVERESLGIVAKDFTPQTMAKALNELSYDKIVAFKKRSKEVASKYEARVNVEKMRKVVKDL